VDVAADVDDEISNNLVVNLRTTFVILFLLILLSLSLLFTIFTLLYSVAVFTGIGKLILKV
jgi:hypothetical protein